MFLTFEKIVGRNLYKYNLLYNVKLIYYFEGNLHLKYTNLLFLAAIFSFFHLTIAFANESGYLIEEMVITSSPFTNQTDTTQNRIWVSEEKFRRVQGGIDEITIGRIDKGLFWIVNQKDSTYSEIDLESMRKLGIMTVAMMGPPIGDDGNLKVPKDLYIRTGEKKKIGEWNAEKIELNAKYANTSFIGSFAMWITKDIDAPLTLYSDMMRNVFGDPNGSAGEILKMWSELGGYPVLIEYQAMGAVTSTLTTKIEKAEIPDEYFTLPAGLTEVSNPFFDQLKDIQTR